MKKTGAILVLFVLMIFPLTLLSQEAEHEAHEELNEEQEESHHKFHRHAIGIFLSHTFISQGVQDNDRNWLVAPSWGLIYNYNLSERWAIGLHNDLIIEEFVVEDRRGNIEGLERSFPFSTAIIGTYRLSEHWAFAAGAGAEWEKNENFGMVRFGAEYGIHITGLNLEVLFALNYDVLIDAYDSFNIGIGIAKLF